MSNDPSALADFDEALFDEAAILKWATGPGSLPLESVRPFSRWLDNAWNEFDDQTGTLTNEDVLKGALAHWTGRA